MVDGGSKLSTAWMMGHMDTGPHPAAALTDALVSALNNNLLFRELSPFASQVEELLIDDFAARMGLPAESAGTFCSGGSIANLTTLFAACGGFEVTDGRDAIALFVPASVHASVTKAAAVLGIPKANITTIAGDDAGRMNLAALESALKASPLPRPIVVGLFGGTVTGALDDLAGIAALCREHNAWFHVDAIYGGALIFSRRFHQLLKGLSEADSIVIAPHKWMFVPRVSAMVLLRDGTLFDKTLGIDLPYSVSSGEHRGRWGLQGSRRADAVTLWATLQVIGTRDLGDMIDDAIVLTARFHEMLEAHPEAEPLHSPDLNVQVFRWQGADRTGERLRPLHQKLTEAGKAWVSLSSWQGEQVFRAVLLNPRTTEQHLETLMQDLSALS